MARVVIHLDLDAFFCAVEEQRDPALIGQPFAVGGRPDQRGVVAACSYPARQYGIHSAMPMAQAVRLCPALIIVPHRFDAYRAASRAVMAYVHDLTPLVEQISIDEAFLDVTGLAGGGAAIARGLQARINGELGLSCSLGVATSKLVAKIANNIGKAGAVRGAPPNAITVVPPGTEADYLSPLPVRELWGVGPKTAERLARYSVKTIGDLARMPPGQLVGLFGKHGAELAERARGIDTRPVEPEHEARSISKETTFAQDIADGDALRRTLRQLADAVGWRLRKAELKGTTVRIKLRWADFTTLTRQTTLPAPVDGDDAIHAAARALFDQHWPPGKPVRLLGVGVSGLEEGAVQLGLWDHDPEKERLQDALDSIKARFGEESIRRASDLE